MPRNTFIVTYDIRDKKRLRKVLKCCRNHGEHIQYSVFECDLSPVEKARFEGELKGIIKSSEDQVLFIPLGPSADRGGRPIENLGIPYIKMDAPCYIF
tara:strand:+ start:181 stop:474 length:294 start_codon:yes stop_codon:yes gene_type:complete